MSCLSFYPNQSPFTPKIQAEMFNEQLQMEENLNFFLSINQTFLENEKSDQGKK